MSGNSNERKNQTLGMSHGTAAGKLRKMVLFRQLKKYKDNICARCSQEIETVDELSIEHLKPWEGISADLFWDLDNVAFSHARCNRPHRLGSPKIITSEGTAWCSRHQKELPISCFHKRASNDDGLQPYCKDCRPFIDIRRNHAKKVSVGC